MPKQHDDVSLPHLQQHDDVIMAAWHDDEHGRGLAKEDEERKDHEAVKERPGKRKCGC